MAIFEITPDRIRPIDETSFQAAGIRERADLQRLLKSQIEVIAPDTLVIAEEFGDWEDSRRRIDLLGLDKDANLVVLELKRTEDGGHMELQALRYAAMVSEMTFDKAVEVYAQYLSRNGMATDARSGILGFLEWDEPDEDHFAQDVRVVLVSAEFSRELTTTVMWLNDRGLDIRCIRVKPYTDNGRLLVDVQQVIPLPEAADYIVKIKEKENRERTARREQSETSKMMLRFWTELLAKARTKTDLHAHISPPTRFYVGVTAGVSGLEFNYAIGRRLNRVELYIDKGDKDENKRIFSRFLAAKKQIEERFGGPLVWERLDEARASRIKAETEPRIIDENDWPLLQDRLIDMMVRLEAALRPELNALG